MEKEENAFYLYNVFVGVICNGSDRFIYIRRFIACKLNVLKIKT